MTKVYNSLNVHTREKEYKIFTQPSQTIPDQSMTIQQILDKHSRGLDLGGSREPIYEEEPSNGINPKSLDLVDIQNMKRENEEKIVHLKSKAEKEKAQKAEKKRKNDAEYKEFIASKNPETGH
jgi:hypothetical protein